MRAKLVFPALAAALLVLAGCDIEDFGGTRYSRDFHFAFPLNATGRLSVESFNGSVEITGWDENTVDISGTKFGPSEAAAENLRVDIDHTPAALSIRVVRPSDRLHNEGARLVIKMPRTAYLDRVTTSNGRIRTMDGAGPARLRTSNGSIRVDHLNGSLNAQTSNNSLDVAGVQGDLILHTSNGSIHARDFRGSLDAETSNNSVTAAVSASDATVRVETSNGGVDLTLPAHYTGDTHVSTRNNSVTVRMPSSAAAHLIAHTSNGTVTTDFDLTMAAGQITRNRVDAQIGTGGGTIDLSTSNGSIRVEKM